MKKPALSVIIAGLMVFLLVSCMSEKDKFGKTWFYTYSNNTSWSNSNWKTNISTSSSKDPVLTPVHFLNLQKNGRYTCYFSDFEYGTWTYQNNTIVLKSNGRRERTLAVHSISDKELCMDIDPANKDNNNYCFEGLPDPYTNEADDPFSAENNQWRIKATAKERNDAVRKRLLNHFRYWEKYFSWGLKTDRQSLDVRSLPGPLKLYGNGFELLPLDKWPDEWRSHFYDEENVQQAYDMLHTFFSSQQIAWPKTDHKFKQFISAFQQLQQKL